MQADFIPREECAICERPVALCLCAHVVRIDTRTRVLVLQHPRESDVPINTARLAELGLLNLKREVGVEFAHNPRVNAALGDAAAPPILLFPSAESRDLALEPPSGPVTLVVLDGTWWQAAKLFKSNPFLAELPRYALNPSEPSRYRIRREPARHCVSTIEAIVQALLVLEGPNSDVPAALRPFDALVEQQLQFAERGHRRHVQHKVRRPKPSPHLLPRGKSAEDVVVAYGEANAWARGTPLGATPEIVHWAAERVATGERFEAFIQPRHAMSPSFEHHTGLDAASALGGMPWNEFCSRWRVFVSESDLLCTWGWYGSDLLKSAGAVMPERLDVRVSARRFLRASPGEVERCAELLGVTDPAPWAPGRTGRRLGALAAVVRELLRRASE